MPQWATETSDEQSDIPIIMRAGSALEAETGRPLLPAGVDEGNPLVADIL